MRFAGAYVGGGTATHFLKAPTKVDYAYYMWHTEWTKKVCASHWKSNLPTIPFLQGPWEIQALYATEIIPHPPPLIPKANLSLMKIAGNNNIQCKQINK